MGVGADDIFFDTTNVLADQGMLPVNPSKFTQDLDSLHNPLIDPAQLDPGTAQETAAVGLSARETGETVSLWDRFINWLDSVFHINKRRG